IVAEPTTLRRHLESDHYNTYQRWAKKADFESALPGDRKARKAAATGPAVQPTLDSHLKELPAKEVIIPYSDARFREAAIEWLVATDQARDSSLCALYLLIHPKFVNMIDIASRAQDGVRIPGKKATRDEIKDLFQQRMAALKKKLNVRRVPFSFFFSRLTLTGTDCHRRHSYYRRCVAGKEHRRLFWCHWPLD
ncbi:hypothetical protein B0H14DRAFT_2373085, partial [Mycena olivaceomarginata]